ncbi:hypothetical protein ACFQ1M_08435 [Sungkyunkwania multivorans]|uniref:Type II secretion system protein n=1 Tax=Sungkyunkwania multivorans TaxID=1173618 RepID=A0ABW3CWS9_9FLAO
MVILKKIKAATLMETMVATVLIMVVFLVVSLIMNNLFSNAIKNDTRHLEYRLNELEYLHQTGELELPYTESLNQWNINITKFDEKNVKYIEFEATQVETQKKLIRKRLDAKK